MEFFHGRGVLGLVFVQVLVHAGELGLDVRFAVLLGLEATLELPFCFAQFEFVFFDGFLQNSFAVFEDVGTLPLQHQLIYLLLRSFKLILNALNTIFIPLVTLNSLFCEISTCLILFPHKLLSHFTFSILLCLNLIFFFRFLRMNLFG